jgi:hypothetical protein
VRCASAQILLDAIYGTSLSTEKIIILLLATIRFLITLSYYVHKRRGSAVNIATGCGLEYRGAGVRFLVGLRMFTSPYRRDRLWGPSSLLFIGYRVLFLRGVDRPGHKASHSHQTSAEMKKTYIHCPHVFMA